MRRRGRLRDATVLVLLVSFGAACSVSTPRDGFTTGVVAGGAPTGATGAPSGGDAALAPGTDDTDPLAPALTAPGAAPAGGATGDSGGGSPGTASDGDAPTSGTAGRASQDGPAAAPSGPPARGVTSKTVTVSAIAGFSGNYGAILTTIFENGFMVWADDVNATGGINGRQVVVKKVDNKDTSEGGVAACKQVVNNGSALAVSIVGFGGADVSAASCLDRAGITTLAFNLSSFSPSWKSVYSAGDVRKQTRPMASFIKNVLGEKKQVAIIWVRDPLNGAARSALVDELPKHGLKVAHEEAVSAGQGSFVAELNRVRSSGAQTVALVVNTAEVLGILRDAKALGFAPKWTGNYWPTDENTAAARSLFEGIKVIRNYATVNSPAFRDYKQKAQKYDRDDVTNSTTMALYGMGLVTGQVIRNAGPQPRDGAFGTGIERLVDYHDGISMAITFGPGVRVADVGMWPMVCCNDDNTWRGIGPPKSAF